MFKESLYKKIKVYLDTTNKNINLTEAKELINSLFISYPNYCKTIKSINVCEFNGNFDGIFKINNKEAFWIPEGLFVENILIKDSDYALKENPKVKIKKENLRKLNKKEKPEFVDNTYLFKHERPYMWSLFYSVLQNNFKILNLEKNSFYLLIKEFNQIIKNEELNIEDIKYKVELKIEYTNSHPNDMLLYFYKD